MRLGWNTVAALSSSEERFPHYVLLLPFSFNSIYDDIIVFKMTSPASTYILFSEWISLPVSLCLCLSLCICLSLLLYVIIFTLVYVSDKTTIFNFLEQFSWIVYMQQF